MTRYCKRCGETKSLDAFRERTRVLSTRVDRWHVTKCRPCEAAVSRERPLQKRRTACRASRARNPVATKQADARAASKKTPEQKKRWSGAYYAKNRDAISMRRNALRETRKDDVNAKQRMAYAEDPTSAKLANARRRAQMRDTESPLTREQWLAIVEAYDDRCAYCGDLYKVIEHVIPLSRGGKNEVGNVVPACEPCNDHKHTKTPVEWIGTTPSGSPPLVLTG